VRRLAKIIRFSDDERSETNIERDREEWTEEDERHPDPPEQPMPVKEEGIAVGLEDDFDADLDPEIAAEVQIQEETREAEEEFGPIEDAVEDPADD
jgi:hypothetical protein